MDKANNAVPGSRKVNGKVLTGDIRLNAGDVGALPISSTLIAQTGTLRINNGSDWPNIEFRAANKHFIGIEGTGGDYLTIYANNENGNRKYNLLTPAKGGTLATLDDITVNAVPNSRKVNGKALTGDINLSAGDVGAQLKGNYALAGTSYTKGESDSRYQKRGLMQGWRRIGGGGDRGSSISLSEDIRGKCVYLHTVNPGMLLPLQMPPIDNVSVGAGYGLTGWIVVHSSNGGHLLSITEGDWASIVEIYLTD
ncbi:hypothetical protein [Photorhabdus sp. SF281]|uniref:hypothetical protein n=1 Tax=Photorhabdus sp. SF281 TaxID=3459527 RepID=UPI004043D0F3